MWKSPCPPEDSQRRDVEGDDTFVFNDQFTASLYRIKVNAIQMKETVEENTSTTESIFRTDNTRLMLLLLG
ncbi:hypothetical protein K7X08_034116 [Anisodus acutangulus]|uniref:Uncharacterized protein n=1 Tax=Anisodus acutangulus TaxID=402998 RepID=A0A9Q1LX46_9SOLA|nr:hypothetical protein K7X08_034116 [Anisodus acutangulus]